MRMSCLCREGLRPQARSGLTENGSARAASNSRSLGAATESRKLQPALKTSLNLLELCGLERAQLPEKPGGGHGQTSHWNSLGMVTSSSPRK
jgi:hypothetical protein